MAKSTVGAVKVDGLADFRKRLRDKADDDLAKEFKQVNYELGEEVVEHARYNAAGVSRMAYEASLALKAARSGFQAEIRFTNRRGFEHAAEFGSGRNITRYTRRGAVVGWNQFKPWRGNGRDAGYFLYPALRDISAESVKKYNGRLGEIMAYAFPD